MAAEYDHLPVYKAAYDLLQHVYRDKCIASVPRDVKYTLVERLKQDILATRPCNCSRRAS